MKVPIFFIDPGERYPGTYDVWDVTCETIWKRTGPQPPPPPLPKSRRPTFTKPGPRWQLRTWLDTDMESWMP